eukprot:jgi/Mesen1/5071/ME000252S04183
MGREVLSLWRLHKTLRWREAAYLHRAVPSEEVSRQRSYGALKRHQSCDAAPFCQLDCDQHGFFLAISRWCQEFVLRRGVICDQSGQNNGFKASYRNVNNIYTSLLLAAGAASQVAFADGEQQAPAGLAPASTEGPELKINPDELVKAEGGEVASNSHTARWRVFTDLGRDLFSQGKMGEAERYFRQAIEEAKQGFGADDPHVASSCNNLAELYRMRREYEQAEPLYLEAVARLRQAMGPHHHSVGLALHNLGSFYLLQRKLDLARRYYEIKGKSLGPSHPEYASTMFHLGEVLRQQGHGAEALSLVRDSVQILEDGGGAHTAAAARRMGRLAQLLVQAGQLEEAEALQRKILHIVEMLQGSDGLGAATASENLASTLQAREKLDEAEEFLQRCLQIRQKVLSPTHRQVGSTLFKLASVMALRADQLAPPEAAAREYVLAVELLQRAVRIAEQHWAQVLEGPAAAAAAAAAAGEGNSSVAAAMLAQHLSFLASCLNALALVLSKTADLAVLPAKVRPVAVSDAAATLRQCLALFSEPSVPAAVLARPDVERERLLCLVRLVSVLQKQKPAMDAAGKKRAEVEISDLLRMASVSRETQQGAVG